MSLRTMMRSRATCSACSLQPSQAGRAWLSLPPRTARPDFVLSRSYKRASLRKGISCAAGTGSADTSGATAPQPALAAAAATGASPSSAASSRSTTLKQQAQASNQEVYDKLIAVFQQKTPEEWRKLIAFSRQWPTLAQGVLDRVAERASATSDLNEQLALRKFRRKLESVHQELSDYRDLIEEFRQAPSREWESMVVQHRPAMSTPFFDYLELRVRAAHENKPEQEALVALAAQLAALVEAHDRVMRDGEAMDVAADSFGSLLEVDSLEQAERKIDELASSGKLDPALLLTMAKAYAGAKETDITREEVKDLLAHLYFKAKETFAQQQPPEVRILKYLLTIDSPANRYKLMEMAFEQGPQLVTGSQDYLSTTPEALLNTITNVLAVYDKSSGAGTMAGQAAGLMSPEVIATLRDMEQVIRKKYM